jgi:hypothetical protein
MFWIGAQPIADKVARKIAATRFGRCVVVSRTPDKLGLARQVSVARVNISRVCARESPGHD